MVRGIAALVSPILCLAHVDKYDEKLLLETFGDDPKFLWGGATAAAQIEGAWDKDGKQPSIWDDFCHSKEAITGDTNIPNFSKQCGEVPEGGDPEMWTTLAVADNFYHTYDDDIKLLSSYNMNSMRISISWPRLFPLNPKSKRGRHKLNPAGVEFYRNVFASMKKHGVTPFVTLFHWDLPNDLSWLNEKVVEQFADYAEAAFKAFPEVENWATFNEPNSVCSLGYAGGWFAPGHRSKTGAVECAHNVLKSHAEAVHRFRDDRANRHKQIGIVLDYKWAYPKTHTQQDRKAAMLDIDNVLGVWADPIFKGDYPDSLKAFYGDHLGKFTRREKKLLKGSADFFGLNTYGGKIAVWNDKTFDDYQDGDDIVERYTHSPCDGSHDEEQANLDDPDFECGAASGWLWAKPDAMFQYLKYVHDTYKPKNGIYVTEFGIDLPEEGSMTQDQSVKDTLRQEYYKRYIMQIAKAKNDGVPVKGMFAWSLMDNFEWGDGLNFRFGITYVDFKQKDLPRTPKGSAHWWQDLIGKMNTGVCHGAVPGVHFQCVAGTQCCGSHTLTPSCIHREYNSCCEHHGVAVVCAFGQKCGTAAGLPVCLPLEEVAV